MTRREKLLYGLVRKSPPEERPAVRSGFRFLEKNMSGPADTLVVIETIDAATGSRGMDFYSPGAKGLLNAMHESGDDEFPWENTRLVPLSAPGHTLLTPSVAKALGYAYSEIAPKDSMRTRRVIALRPMVASDARKRGNF
jgi:hypothetical protein